MSLVEAATPAAMRGGYSSSRGGDLRRANMEISNNEELNDPTTTVLRSDAEDEDDEASTQSSSIGEPDDDDDVTDDDEVKSTLSLGALEDSLPVKRGLSKFYAGKSKSFANLTEVRNVNDIKELGKSENPFNKRRRTLMAYNLMFKQDKILKDKKMKSAGLFYSHSNHISMPLLPLPEIDDDDDDEDDDADLYLDTASFPLQQIEENGGVLSHPVGSCSSYDDNRYRRR